MSKVIDELIQMRFRQRVGSDDAAFELDVDLELSATGTTAVFGESGAGKTTLLRCIAGLQPCRDATLRVAGSTWQDDSVCIPPHQRPVGYVFQQPGLFEHLTVRGNLEFARRRASKGVAGVAFDDAVEMLGIGALLAQRATSLSGGEQQRVAIARALLSRPRLLLMDEPLASLDAARKQDILPFLETVRAHAGVPMIYVSHSVDEVMHLADEVVVMRAGRAVRQGSVPETLGAGGERIADGLECTIIDATPAEIDARWQLRRVEFPGGALWLAASHDSVGSRVRVRVFARDVSITRSPANDSSIANILPAKIVKIPDSPDSPTLIVQLAVGPTPLLAELTRRSVDFLGLQVGQSVWAQIKSAAIVRDYVRSTE